ncbi:N-alpha-acetyltransferase 80 isoform X2 [Vespula squamosa]|uniref:N-alpha-acetyltransferase 80 isoform X2 n=1 Tax=Vespula squamosa TaxID=30214 RepID=A0ABD2AB74_VESSQ
MSNDVYTDIWYDVIPLHHRPELVKECCKLLNTEWPRSETARLKSLKVSCDDFPTCLVLLDRESRVLGHCKVSLIPKVRHSCYIESVVVDYKSRAQGLGSRLLRGTEEYVARKGFKTVYLITKGQELFYIKNGYTICDPIETCGYRKFLPPTTIVEAKHKEKNTLFSGPPPPPMPQLVFEYFDIRMLSQKTHMVKKL